MQLDRLKQTAIVLVYTKIFNASVATADAMLKSAAVTLVGYEKIGGGHCTAIVRGSISEIRMAVDAGSQTAEKDGQLVSAHVIPRPFPNLEAIFPIGSRISELEQDQPYRISNQAIGLLETRGFPTMVGAIDAMLKSADIELTSYETIGAALCTAIIRGSVADIVVALQVGMAEAERIEKGSLNAITVIPRPLEDLERTLPTASCLIEAQPEPLRLPIDVKEVEKELVELPDLAKLPIPLKE